ncbi:TlyA family rRNA (cytidine-2'-O)-methyltransferase [Deltaproteobacteria bacterium Smac51]|nr:TlyA family rRNA (cytidine-2'-O)-methyltransferase [Deltaproteobacteria bacterium Smac51]
MATGPGGGKKRADELVFAQGLARSRSQAQALIMAGQVMCGEKKVIKAGEQWPSEAVFSLTALRRFVSRGGHKLEGALEDLKVDPAGLAALDVGASTGGFTDCLLQHGASSVTAVDVGRNLIDWGLRQDARVTVIEGINARRLTDVFTGAPPADTEQAVDSACQGAVRQDIFDLAVIDVSFISLELIIGQVAALMRPDGRILAMVKPQFEVGRDKVGKKGVVKNQADIDEAVDKISAFGAGLVPPWREVGRAPSRLPGPEGNREVFLLFEPVPLP